MQFEDDLAIRRGIGGASIIGVLIIESDAVESVFCHGMGQNLGELRGLRAVHAGDADALMVTEYGKQDFDALVLQRFHISQITVVFQQIGHLVIEVEGRLDHTVDRTFTDVRCEEFHDTGKRLAVRHRVVTRVKRVGVIGFDIDRHDRRIAECAGFGSLSLIHSRFFGLLAGEHCGSDKESHR